MAKEKPLGVNPALAHHRKAKKDQARKAKADRTKQRDEKLQHKRPERLQARADELRLLKDNGKLNAHDVKLLDGLERDLKRIEQLRAKDKGKSSGGPIITSERTQERQQQQRQRDSHDRPRQRYDDWNRRLPKDPTKSVYYDPIFNPYGAAPPGMPYREHGDETPAVERDAKQVAVSQDDEESDASSIAYVPFPPGTPPPVDGDDSDQSNDEVDDNDEKEVATSEVQERATTSAIAHVPLETAGKEVAQGSTQSSETQPARSAPPRVTYGAEPQIRDLKKEAASFIPSTLKRARLDRGGAVRASTTESTHQREQAATAMRSSVERIHEGDAEEEEEVIMPGTLRRQDTKRPRSPLANVAGLPAEEVGTSVLKKPRRLNIAPR